MFLVFFFSSIQIHLLIPISNGGDSFRQEQTAYDQKQSQKGSKSTSLVMEHRTKIQGVLSVLTEMVIILNHI